MNPSALSNELLSTYRADFPHLTQPHYYLDHAAYGVLSTKVNGYIEEHLKSRSTGIIQTWFDDLDVIEQTRSKIARLINAPSSDQIAFITNTSEGLNLIASGFDWRSGQSILLNDIEFPSNVYPYTNVRRFGVDIRFATSQNGIVDTQTILNHFRPTDRIIGISAIQFLSGYKVNLETLGEFCKDRDTYFIVDGMQAAGNSTIDVQKMNIDGFVSGGLKWLMAPMGIGFVYMSARLMNLLRPPHVGWLSVETPWDLFNYEQGLNPTARRYELGGLNVTGIYGLNKSLDPFLEIGTDHIHDHLLHLTDLIEQHMAPSGLRRFTTHDAQYRSGILSYDLPETIDGDEFVNELKNHYVTVSHRAGKLRFSPHFYNNDDDIERAIEIILEIFRKTHLI
jgi:cysteine desulfurase / selenocysteine lyase